MAPAALDRVPTGQIAMAYTVTSDIAMANIPPAYTAMVQVPAVLDRVPTGQMNMA